MTFDSFSSAMYNDGDFALSPYLPYTLVPFYPLFQERGAPRVERGQEDWDAGFYFALQCRLIHVSRIRTFN